MARVNRGLFAAVAAGVLALALPLGAARAAGAPALVPLCASCHGDQGLSASPMIPNLAGQQQGYLSNALHDYKAKQRQGGSAAMMIGLAAHLSDADIAALSAYYASLKRN
ncbi:c-type cytochrome [Acidisoma silvae]|uniref:C-type cytochrome n=1 Tax=Acidisoma silvae TaxID=2802396 RepID=A0A964E0H7_9PROT|nr:c-type cytochrome [Acidisoma silvae]MCB8877169.1 c-type cytochrome [Acidisoma silvae]